MFVLTVVVALSWCVLFLFCLLLLLSVFSTDCGVHLRWGFCLCLKGLNMLLISFISCSFLVGIRVIVVLLKFCLDGLCTLQSSWRFLSLSYRTFVFLSAIYFVRSIVFWTCSIFKRLVLAISPQAVVVYSVNIWIHLL